jgi:hypothetical protein
VSELLPLGNRLPKSKAIFRIAWGLAVEVSQPAKTRLQQKHKALREQANARCEAETLKALRTAAALSPRNVQYYLNYLEYAKKIRSAARRQLA